MSSRFTVVRAWILDGMREAGQGSQKRCQYRLKVILNPFAAGR